jgi:hypothetical protein
VAGHVPPTVAVLAPAGSATCLLTIGSDSLDALAFHAAMLDLDFTVLAPPELITRLATLAGRLMAASYASLARHTP